MKKSNCGFMDCSMCCSDSEDCIIELGKPDTYIEYLFFKKVVKLRNGKDIAQQWLTDKDIAIKLIERTKLDFEHYSKHDKAHSENILDSILLLLGKCRLKLLSAADLWFLLEAAYFHDIGMSIDYDELYSMWINENKFKEYFRDSLYRNDVDTSKCFQYIKRIDYLISKKKLESLDEDDWDGECLNLQGDWVITLPKYIKIVTAEFIRQNHGEYAKEKICILNQGSKIEARLYKVVAEISRLHTCRFEEIFSSLQARITGIGGNEAHPQFIACLLRIGDLLDMDNNRFDFLLLKHFGKLPQISQLHFEKHRAIEFLHINEYQIKAIARSNDIEVCSCIYQWFSMLDEEVRQLICHWSAIAPSKLGGCLLRICDLKVYCGESEYTNKSRTYYNIDKEHALELLRGDNLYSESLDFIREYVQNAIDATRLQFWMDAAVGHKMERWRKTVDVGNSQIYINDFQSYAYDEYAIKININIINLTDKSMTPQVRITISDKGTGIEEEGIEALTVIGSGWKKRKTIYGYGDFGEMALWLRPTGGFGIGTQAAFMVTDKVVFETKAENEIVGHRISLTAPRLGGEVLVEKFNKPDRGTDVIIDVPLRTILSYKFWKSISSEENETERRLKNFIDQPRIMDRNIANALMEFLRDMIGDLFMFPIEIRTEKQLHSIVENSFVNPRSRMYKCGKREDFIRIADIDFDEIKHKNKEYLCYYNDSVNEGKIFILFDKEDCSITRLSIKDGENKLDLGKCECFYKGIKIKNETIRTIGFSAEIDTCDVSVKKHLKLNRDEFINSEYGEKLINDKISNAIDLLLYYTKCKPDFSKSINFFWLLVKYGEKCVMEKIFKGNVNELINNAPEYKNFEFDAIVDNNEKSENTSKNLFAIVYDTKTEAQKVSFVSRKSEDVQGKGVNAVYYIDNDGVFSYLYNIFSIMKIMCDDKVNKDEILIDFTVKKNIDDIIKIDNPDALFKQIKKKQDLVYAYVDDKKEPCKDLYPKIWVSEVPVYEKKSPLPCLITAIDNMIIKNIDDIRTGYTINSKDVKGVAFNIDELKENMKSSEVFSILIDWVWNHQVERPRIPKKDIIKEYEKMLEEYFNWEIKYSEGINNKYEN